MTYKPSKIGQTDLFFGLWSEFISRFVYAGLQVSTSGGCRITCATLVNTQTDMQTGQLLTGYTISSASQAKN